MPKVIKVRKNAEKSKTDPKGKVRAKGDKEVKKKQPAQVKAELELVECTFTYSDPEKVAEAERNATGHKVMSVHEYVQSVRPDLIRDIKPKFEPVVKQETCDTNLDCDTEFIELSSEEEVILVDEVQNDPPRRNKSTKESADCPICHKRFKNVYALKQHGYVHKEKTLKCDDCDKVFSRERKLKEHKKTHLLNRETYSCGICQKELLSKFALKCHQSLHQLSREMFKCKICGNEYTSSSALNSHIKRIHEGKNRIIHECKYCERSFKYKPSLITHMRSMHFILLRQQDKETGGLDKLFHGIRTYECYRCKYSMHSISLVKIHMKNCKLNEKKEQNVKQVEKTFEYFECKASFITNDRLIQHMESHCTERGLKHDYCSEQFPPQTDKIEHQRSVHSTLLEPVDSQKYVCHICKVCMPVHMAVGHLAERHQINNLVEFIARKCPGGVI